MNFGQTSVAKYMLVDGDLLVDVKDIQSSGIGAKKVIVDESWFNRAKLSHHTAHKRDVKMAKSFEDSFHSFNTCQRRVGES